MFQLRCLIEIIQLLRVESRYPKSLNYFVEHLPEYDKYEIEYCLLKLYESGLIEAEFEFSQERYRFLWTVGLTCRIAKYPLDNLDLKRLENEVAVMRVKDCIGILELI